METPTHPPTRDAPSDCQIAMTMIACGGDFVRELGALYQRADPENQRRIKAAWPEYWAKYAAMTTRAGVPRSVWEGDAQS